MTEPDLSRVAEEYAELFNQIEPEDVKGVIAEAVVSPYWDDRTNLFLMMAQEPTDLALVLATEPDSDDCLVVRWVGEWVVDPAPVDWEAMEDALDDPLDFEGFDADPFDDDRF